MIQTFILLYQHIKVKQSYYCDEVGMCIEETTWNEISIAFNRSSLIFSYSASPGIEPEIFYFKHVRWFDLVT